MYQGRGRGYRWNPYYPLRLTANRVRAIANKKDQERDNRLIAIQCKTIPIELVDDAMQDTVVYDEMSDEMNPLRKGDVA